MTEDALLDTHCHIGAYPDPVAVIAKARAAGIAMVAVTESPDEFRRLKTRLGPRADVEVALGLHPLHAASFTPHDIARFFRLVPRTRWIGEVGLDFSPLGEPTREQQMRVFDTVLTEAQPGRHPLTVHSRRAEKEVIARLVDARVPAVLHWYSGPLRLIDDALEAGLYFSVNPAMTCTKRFPSLLKAIPPQRILLETDGPYARSQGRPATPADLIAVVSQLSEHWQSSAATVAQIVRTNQKLLTAGTPAHRE
jgi:TatD DNase family protein